MPEMSLLLGVRARSAMNAVWMGRMTRPALMRFSSKSTQTASHISLASRRMDRPSAMVLSLGSIQS